MLVQEVTRDVKIPTVYHPHTDYSPQQQGSSSRSLPLTYEDLAVPVDRDPFYEQRFNASAAVAARNAGGERSDRIAELERRFAEAPPADPTIAGLYSSTQHRSGQHHSGGPARAIPQAAFPGDQKRWIFRDPTQQPSADPSGLAASPSRGDEQPASVGLAGAQFASSDSSTRSSGQRGDILGSGVSGATATRASAGGERSVLSELPPPNDSAGADGADRPKHWIRQPD